jgi:hypothetical protein
MAMTSTRDDYTDPVFAKRAVLAEVAAARGYRRYEKGGRATVCAVDERLLEDAGWLSRALIVGGWAIPKLAPMPDHPVFGWQPYAQLRPDRPVMVRYKVHDHDGMLHRHRDEGRCQCGENHTRKPVKRVAWPSRELVWSWYQLPLRGLERLKHEASTCDWADVPEGLVLPVPIIDKRAHGKVLVPTGHLHPDTGEVVVPVEGRHAHLEWAKYLYVPGEGKAQRLNTHPWMLEKQFAAPEGLFTFVIEGTLKLDSVVSAEWPGIESGSVTLWDAYAEEDEAEWEQGDLGEMYLTGGTFGYSELEEFAGEHLTRTPTAVICDSDWAENPLVRKQVDKAVQQLANVGVPAVGCAPPPGRSLGWEHPVTGRLMQVKQGVDDYLATFSRLQRHDALLDLHVRDEQAHPPGLMAAVQRAVENPRGAAIHKGLLSELARDAMQDGLVEYRRSSLAKRLERDPRNVDHALKKHVALGHLTRITKAEPVSAGDDGVRSIAPVYLLREDLRAPERPRMLRDWLEDVS